MLSISSFSLSLVFLRIIFKVCEVDGWKRIIIIIKIGRRAVIEELIVVEVLVLTAAVVVLVIGVLIVAALIIEVIRYKK